MSIQDFIKFLELETSYTKEQLYNMSINELYDIVLKRFNKRLKITFV